MIFEKHICDDDDCGGALDIEGICTECGKVVDPLTDAAVAELVQVAYEQNGGVGDAEARVIR